MENFLYGVLTNTGKGFFTAEDRRAFFLRNYPANVWVIGNNERGACWVADKRHKLLGMLKLMKKKLNQIIIDQAI